MRKTKLAPGDQLTIHVGPARVTISCEEDGCTIEENLELIADRVADREEDSDGQD